MILPSALMRPYPGVLCPALAAPNTSEMWSCSRKSRGEHEDDQRAGAPFL